VRFLNEHQHLRRELLHLLRLELVEQAPRGGHGRRELRQIRLLGLALLHGFRQLVQVVQGGFFQQFQLIEHSSCIRVVVLLPNASFGSGVSPPGHSTVSPATGLTAKRCGAVWPKLRKFRPKLTDCDHGRRL
jgi:hypothetical protein